MQCSEIISWVERHYDLLFKVDIVNLLLKNSWWWGGGGGGGLVGTESLILFSWFGVLWLLACGCWQVVAESLI